MYFSLFERYRAWFGWCFRVQSKLLASDVTRSIVCNMAQALLLIALFAIAFSFITRITCVTRVRFSGDSRKMNDHSSLPHSNWHVEELSGMLAAGRLYSHHSQLVPWVQVCEPRLIARGSRSVSRGACTSATAIGSQRYAYDPFCYSSDAALGLTNIQKYVHKVTVAAVCNSQTTAPVYYIH